MLRFDFVFNRVKNLIITPVAEWNIIKTEFQTRNEIIRNYAIPLMIMVVICSMAGDLLFASKEHFTIGYVLTKAFISFAISFSTIYLSAIIINELTVSFNSKKDLNITFKLVVYSFTAYFLADGFSNLLPPLELIKVFALYSIYLFWLGCKPLLETRHESKIGFVVISSIIILSIYKFIDIILNNILTSIFAVATQALN